MQNLDTIHDYLRLCGAPHNLKYVAMSVMLSCFMKTPLCRPQCVLMAT
jgi:hypothetical protein